MARRVILCLCLVLSASLAFAATPPSVLSSNNHPRITTGASSYSPGTYVQIHGTNFAPSAAVTLRVSDTSLAADFASVPFTAQTDATGTFTARWYFRPEALGNVFRVEAYASNGVRAATLFTRTNVQSAIINDFYSGWYSDLGSDGIGGAIHDHSNTNVAVGEFSALGVPDVLHNFFVFNLSGIVGTPTSAVLHVDNPCTSAILGLPTPYRYDVYDVTTSFAQLQATYYPPLSSIFGSPLFIWNDLGSGVNYGNVLFPPADANAAVIDIPLNAAALAKITSSLNGILMFGGKTTGPGFMMACGYGVNQAHLEITGVYLTSPIQK